MEVPVTICNDIGEFLEVIRKMRVVDDKIVNALNTTIPTESFSSKTDVHATCEELFFKLVESHVSREKIVQQCLTTTSEKLQNLKVRKLASPNDLDTIKLLRREQNKLRELQTEVNVEEVIRGRTLKIFNERCRAFFRPPSESA